MSSMADTTAPTAESAPSAPAEEIKPVETTTTEATDEPEEPATMSGALQSPDADVSKAPEATEESKVNGDASEAAPTTEAAPTEDKPAETAGDTEMKDIADEPAATGSEAPAAPEAEGDSSAKKQPNGKRKSTGGVPEHKGKKLNKKKSQQKITHLDAQPGEYYFARLKSYPPWPSIICDEEMLPVSLLKTRPVTTKQPDGTYKEPFAEGGKRIMERTFPIMFLYTNEFAWIPNTDLTTLHPDECKDVAEKGKSKSLIAAYNVASEGHDLQFFKGMLADHERAMNEEVERQEQIAAEKAAKAAKSDSKKKRKSDAAVAEDVEMEDAADEEAETKPKSSKKRKKEADSEEEEKPAKTPKTATKLKLTTPKAPATAESSKKGKDSAKPAKSKTPSTKKGKNEEPEKEPEKPVDPAEQKAKKEKEVLFLRHKLQKGFLTRDSAPREDEMITMSGYIDRLEEFGNELEVSIIRATKVNKVLKAIIKLNTIPKDEEFNFRKRSHDLLESWNKLLGTETADAGASTKEAEPSTNGANGVHKEDKEAEAEPAPKVAAPTAAADVAEEKPLPEKPAEAKETIVDGLVDGPAASGAVAAEADKPAEEVKNDAKETEPSTAEGKKEEEAPKTEMEGVEASS